MNFVFKVRLEEHQGIADQDRDEDGEVVGKRRAEKETGCAWSSLLPVSCKNIATLEFFGQIKDGE